MQSINLALKVQQFTCEASTQSSLVLAKPGHSGTSGKLILMRMCAEKLFSPHQEQMKRNLHVHEWSIRAQPMRTTEIINIEQKASVRLCLHT